MSTMTTENNDQVAAPADPLEILEPSVAERPQAIGLEDNVRVYVQRPLSFFGKMDLFSVLGRALDRAMSGPDGIQVAALLEDVPVRDGELAVEDLRDADAFVRGIAKLISYAPEILGDLYCVILDVPKGERDVAKAVMAQHESRGGLTDKDGVDILDTFMKQNWEVLRDFFKEQIAPLIATAVSQGKGTPPSA